MKISSIQIGWALAAAVMLGFFMPWTRPAASLDDSMEIAAQLAGKSASAQLLSDYVLLCERDRQALRGNPAAGESGYQLAVSGGESALILFGGDAKAKLLLLAPLLAIGGALALVYWKKAPRLLIAMGVASLLFYLFARRQLCVAYVDRLVLELNWGIWLTLYGLVLLATVQIIRAALPAKVKW